MNQNKDIRPFSCKFCPNENLAICERCGDDLYAKMFQKVMEESPEHKHNWLLQTILEELREVKQELRLARIKNLEVKPNITGMYDSWGMN